MKKRLRITVSIVLVLLTAVVFGYYLSKHRSILSQLKHTSPSTIIWLLLLYGLWFGGLTLILLASLRICRKSLSGKENFLLNAYSTLVNFFVPGQGGPVVRGLYLKRRHRLLVRNYIVATLLYYGCYAVVSCLLLLAGSQRWWWTLLAVVLIGSVSSLVIALYIRRSKARTNKLDIRPINLLFLLLATALQAAVQVTIYAVELHAVSHHVTLGQVMTYTGAANFALFVALTPGAIGIRESFLVFSERLHHISSTNIVAANVIDRGVFIVFLGILFLLTLGFHAKATLGLKQAPMTSTKDIDTGQV